MPSPQSTSFLHRELLIRKWWHLEEAATDGERNLQRPRDFVPDASLAMAKSHRLSWSHCEGKKSDQQHDCNYKPSFDKNKGFASETREWSDKAKS